VQVGLDAAGAPAWVTCSQHGLGETRAWADVERDPGTDRPVVYVAPFSHANYFQPGTRYYFPAADHPTDRGPSGVPVVLDFGPWQAWRGRWGREAGSRVLGFTVRAFGGVSPDAPVVQETRWRTPAAYAEKARRPVTSWFKTLLWALGKGTYPLAPELREVRRDGERRLLAAYRLRRRPWRRSRDLLVTVHRDEEGQPMVLSRVVRHAAAEGTVVLDLPEPMARGVVWISAFNRLGQRSDATTARAG